MYRCTLAEGTPAVIKTEPDRFDDDEFLSGIDAMLLYGGRGMVRVLRVDRMRRIVLMERVVPGVPLWGETIERALEAAAFVMSKLRSPPPERHAFPNVRAFHLAWPSHDQLHGGPAARRGPLRDASAFSSVRQLRRPVLLHDPSYGNVLSSERDGGRSDPMDSRKPCYESAYLFSSCRRAQASGFRRRDAATGQMLGTLRFRPREPTVGLAHQCFLDLST